MPSVEHETLLNAIHKSREEVKTDNGRISISEIITRYKDRELILDPNFQRLFRWSIVQKSRLIESILLGIPLPPVFVAVDKDGCEVVIDGVQRLSSILEFTGNLPLSINQQDLEEDEEDEDDQQEDDQQVLPLVEAESQTPPRSSFEIQNVKKIKELNGRNWDDLGTVIQRLINKTYISVVSISSVQNEHTKFELFQRLNTGGAVLSPQEIRNCLMIMKDESIYEKMADFSGQPIFLKVLNVSDSKIKEKYPMELLVRYLIAKRNKYKIENYPLSYTEIKDFFDDEIVALIEDKDFDIDSELNQLNQAIELLDSVLGGTSFKKKYRGAFSNSAFEGILVGLVENLSKYNAENIKNKLDEMYENDIFKVYSKHGRKALDRFFGLNDLSRRVFQ
ncbi:DUF262 domain-containing protein [Acinetobacter dispersus]|uniref:DUF262 domain-containing protein n=1 Tax=Acinetobacter dispersus TaxID=70348 RepID=UPI001F4B631F|nr:DUF262 domain-containing protein [Acinetobacter dispersus]MCH7390892.1 DUF262 domain-containing protein [Acinetobacter dispersus]